MFAPTVRGHDQHRLLDAKQGPFGDAAEEQTGQGAPAMTSQHHQIRDDFGGELRDHRGWWRSHLQSLLDGDPASAKT